MTLPEAGVSEQPSSLRRLELVASALSGRAVAVMPVEPGEPAWTDGHTIFLDADLDTRGRLETLTVQACLIAAGSLEPDMARALTRRAELVRRYLALEGWRAVGANEDLLPPVVSSLVDHDRAARTDSAAGSLRAARSGEHEVDLPWAFGTIPPRKLLARERSTPGQAASGTHILRRDHTGALAELGDGCDEGEQADDPFSSPVGGGGALGKLLSRMLGVTRRLGGGGQPGADAPTHRAGTGVRGGGAVLSHAHAAPETGSGDTSGTHYPEWDVHRRRYRRDWCTVAEIAPAVGDVAADASWDGGLRRRLARLGGGPQRRGRQPYGDDVDIDAAVEAYVAAAAGSTPQDAVYLDTWRGRRDLGVLILLDVSGSAAEPATAGQTVHQQQRAVAAALTGALHDLGDRVALYAFASHGRSAVRVMPIKRFDELCDTAVLRRLHGVKPGAYSRLGAAIRHGTAVLAEHAGTPRRVLVVISDGLAYDHGYDRVYGAADAARALSEARGRGVGCLCLTIGASTDADARWPGCSVARRTRWCRDPDSSPRSSRRCCAPRCSRPTPDAGCRLPAMRPIASTTLTPPTGRPAGDPESENLRHRDLRRRSTHRPTATRGGVRQRRWPAACGVPSALRRSR